MEVAFHDNLFQTIRKARPSVEDITIERYILSLRKLAIAFGASTSLAFLNNPQKVLDVLKEKGYAVSTQRSYLNAIIVYLSSLNDLSMNDLIAFYSSARDQKHKDWLGTVQTSLEKITTDTSDILEVIARLNKEVTTQKLLSKRGGLSLQQFQLLQKYLLLMIYSAYPLRNEWANLEVIGPREAPSRAGDGRNYLIVPVKTNVRLWIQKHKTVKSAGPKTIPIDKPISDLIKKWLKISPNPDFLLVTHSGAVINKNQLTKLLQKYSEEEFGAKLGSSAFRKIYLSSKYSDVKEEMADDAEMLGHSVGTQQKFYVKGGKDEE